MSYRSPNSKKSGLNSKSTGDTDPFADLVSFKPKNTKKSLNEQIKENKSQSSQNSSPKVDQDQGYFSNHHLDLDFFNKLENKPKITVSKAQNNHTQQLDPFSNLKFESNTTSIIKAANAPLDFFSDFNEVSKPQEIKEKQIDAFGLFNTTASDNATTLLDTNIADKPQIIKEKQVDDFGIFNEPINEDITLLDAKIAELVSYGYDFDASKVALSMCDNDVLEAKELMDQQKRVEQRNNNKSNNNNDDDNKIDKYDYESEEEEVGYYDYKNQNRGLFDTNTSFNKDQLLNQANEIGNSMFSAANKLFMRSKQTLNTTWQEIKSMQGSSGTNTPNSNTSRSQRYYNDESDESNEDINNNEYGAFKDDLDSSIKNNFNSNSPTPVSVIKKEKPLPKDDIIANEDQLKQSEKFRLDGNHHFKLGQFSRSIEYYTKAIQILPKGHSSLIAIYNNRAISYSKLANYKDSINDSEEALNIIGQDIDYVPKTKLDGKAGLNLKEGYTKAILRKAEALEALERFKEAEETYVKLLFLANCSANNKALDGVRRCKKAINIPKSKVDAQKNKEQNFDDILTEFSLDFNKLTTIDAKPKVTKAEIDSSIAVQKIRQLELVKEQEENIRLNNMDKIEDQIKNWKLNKENNLRALLASLDVILWQELNWKKVELSQLLEIKKVKRTYMLAISKLHPDKLSESTVEQKLLAAAIFNTLNRAWDQFKQQNNV